jgi:uncharacterized low-complexity protein
LPDIDQGALKMAKKSMKKPLAAAIGAAFVTSLSAAPVAQAGSDNPFAASSLSSGYQVASNHMEGKCGEGKCGGKKKVEKKSEGKCGEGKCGGKKKVEKKSEGKCGEGKCGAQGKAQKKGTEGKCGGNK